MLAFVAFLFVGPFIAARVRNKTLEKERAETEVRIERPETRLGRRDRERETAIPIEWLSATHGGSAGIRKHTRTEGMNDMNIDLLTGPWLGLGITILVLGITGISFVRVFLPMMKGAKNLMQAQTAAANLRLTGLPAQARITGIQGTGTSINNQPECQLDLDVFRPNAPPYQVRVRQVVSQWAMPRVQPGLMVPVKIDAANPMNVALDV